MKTAMQELIDELDLTKIANRDKLVMVKYIIAKCLELEKEQIIDAHGLKYYDIGEVTITGEQYYNETYNK